MKGLIRNNFYSVGNTLYSTIALCLAANVIAIFFIAKNHNIAQMLMTAQVGAFVGLTGTALQKDNSSKWNKFEKTLPVTSKDVVTARYVSFLIFAFIGMVLATFTLLVSFVVSPSSVNLERIGYSYSFGITFALLVPSLIYPLVLKFGSDKSETLLLICCLVVVGMFIGGSALFAPILKNSIYANTIFRLGSITFSVIMFVVSYLVSLKIYKAKEL